MIISISIVLRLALCEDSDTRAFVCSSELALFRLRLAEMGSGEWNSFFKKTEKELSQLLSMSILVLNLKKKKNPYTSVL